MVSFCLFGLLVLLPGLIIFMIWSMCRLSAQNESLEPDPAKAGRGSIRG